MTDLYNALPKYMKIIETIRDVIRHAEISEVSHVTGTFVIVGNPTFRSDCTYRAIIEVVSLAVGYINTVLKC